MRVRAAALATAALWAFGTGGVRSAEAGPEAFPEITEVLQGRIFDTKFDRDVVFLRRIREDFHRHWADFLEANLTEKEFVQVPDKMAKFLEKLAKSTAGTDDATTAEKLAVLVTDPVFYANTNAYRPDLLTAAARTLIGLGPKGCQAFAGTFSLAHYRTDPVSLELFAEVAGKSGTGDPKVQAGLAAVAFTFATERGGSFPRCTRVAVRQLLALPGGVEVVRPFMHAPAAMEDPGRFRDIVVGIVAARVPGLKGELEGIARQAVAKLAAMPPGASAYRDEVTGLRSALEGK